ncbi:MAG: Cysteine desulfurase [Caulobacter sp.]|nr:Cysteine desulfurase [Caulobacter sp.]
MSSSQIYLDGHSTTPLAPEAEAAMAPLWRSAAANVDSPHAMGVRMASVVERARRDVALLTGCDPQEIVFTSGATEANNLALLGVAKAAMAIGSQRKRVVISAIEHKSILAVGDELVRLGFEVVSIPAGSSGVVDLDEAKLAIGPDTLIVSAMLVNNETGIIQPVKEIATIARAAGAVMHTDAAQACGRIPVDLLDLDVDLASISAHKMYGPAGVGALFVSATSPLRPHPLFFGGGQEGGLRPGTLPGPLIGGFGSAAAVSRADMVGSGDHCHILAKRLLEQLNQSQVRFVEVGNHHARVPGSLCLAFEGVDADELIASLSPAVCLSSGSACSSGQITSSHVLKSMKISPSLVDSIVRIYCGRYNTLSEIELAAGMIAEATFRLAVRTGRTRQ